MDNHMNSLDNLTLEELDEIFTNIEKGSSLRLPPSYTVNVLNDLLMKYKMRISCLFYNSIDVSLKLEDEPSLRVWQCCIQDGIVECKFATGCEFSENRLRSFFYALDDAIKNHNDNVKEMKEEYLEKYKAAFS